MLTTLIAAVAMSATFSVEAVKILPVNVASYSKDANVSVTMQNTGGRVKVDVTAKGYAAPFVFHWQAPQDAGAEVTFSKTVTAKAGDQLAGDWRTDVGPGYYSVWVYDATGRFPIAYGCLVIPTP